MLLFAIMVDGAIGQNDYVVIQDIQFNGLKKTHAHVLGFDMDIKIGDTILLDELATKLSEDEKRLESTSLFTAVKVNLKDWSSDKATLEVTVNENWYIYPYVIFELADRNFNVWRKEFNYSFKRINYGAALTHINFSGHKDKFKVKYQQGFIRKYELFYEYPYLYKAWGLSANVLYTENKENSYISKDNILQFYKDPNEKVVFYQHRASLTVHHRTSAYLTQAFRTEYIHPNVNDAIAKELNPRYLNGFNKLPFVYLRYNLIWNRTHYPLYPLSGYRLELNISKDGFDSKLNNLWTSLDIEYHLPFKRRWILSSRVKTRIYLANNGIPYFLYNGLGYSNDVLTGYQLNVIDGDNYVFNKNALKYKLVEKEFVPKFWIPKQFKSINYKVFLRANFDHGYVNDPIYGSANSLSNAHIYGYGPGLDIILFNNFTLSADYSWKKTGERGLFFSSGFNF
jgi:hypothetical protein